MSPYQTHNDQCIIKISEQSGKIAGEIKILNKINSKIKKKYGNTQVKLGVPKILNYGTLIMNNVN